MTEPGPARQPHHASARDGDARAVFEVMAAQELQDTGEVAIEEADIVGDWQRPAYDVSASTIGVFDGDRLVGVRRGDGRRPRRRRRPPRPPRPRHRHGAGPVDAGAGPRRRLVRHRHAGAAGLGRRPAARGARLPRPLGELGAPAARGRRRSPRGRCPTATPCARRPPTTTRPAGRSIEDAFLEWSERERQPFEDFAAPRWSGGPGFEPWNLRVVADPDGAVVGVTHVVLAGGRRRATSHGRHPHATSAAAGSPRRCWSTRSRSPAPTAPRRSGLSTDSRTGALGLYEKVGMQVTSTWVNRAIEV